MRRNFYITILLSVFCVLFFQNTVAQFGIGAGSCNVNINCSEGDNWQLYKRSVVRMFKVFDNKSIMGTGVLLNNSKNDYTPYVLTAFHVLDYIMPSDYDSIPFYFNYESPSCENPVTDDALNKQVVKGFTIIASSPTDDLDFVLMKLNQPVPREYNPYFAGWTNVDNSFTGGVCIHHPRGDIKKVSTVQGINKTDHFWQVNFIETLNGHGITEIGSSGSPLFTRNGLVTGILHGGDSGCGEQENAWDLFGCMAYNFNKYTNRLNSLKTWLNPDSSTIETLQGISYLPAGITKTTEKPFIEVFPNPTSNILNISINAGRIPTKLKIVNMFGQGVLLTKNIQITNNTIQLSVNNLKRGLYLINIEFNGFSTYKKFEKL